MSDSENNTRTGFLERAQSPLELRPIYVVGYPTGARVGELLTLLWSQVDFHRRRITLEPATTKNKEGRSLPNYGDTLVSLDALREKREQTFLECPSVFHESGKPPLSASRGFARAKGRDYAACFSTILPQSSRTTS